MNLLSDVKKLEKKVEMLKGNNHDINAIEAWSEACFRIALNPLTEPSEAIGKLMEAYSVDGTNPKYPYHIARLFFSLGDFQTSAQWLTKAIKLCPTSHRLWTHISLIHYELNERFKGNYNLEPEALRKRSDEITKLIRTGKDEFDEKFLDFTPPESLASIEAKKREHKDKGNDTPPENREDPPEKKDEPPTSTRVALPKTTRLQNPGECRWSGINDIIVERLLEYERSDRIKIEIGFQLLPEIAKQCVARKGGGSSFAILAVQWLLTGYPVSTIRRIRKESTQGIDDESIRLLDIVCEMFDTPAEKLPSLISRALQEKSLPPLLAALIHNKCLLWRPIHYGAKNAYRSACRILSEKDAPSHDISKINSLINTLLTAAAKINVPPQNQLTDIQVEQKTDVSVITDPEEACRVLGELENKYTQLVNHDASIYKFISEEIVPRAAALPDSGTERNSFIKNVQKIKVLAKVISETATEGANRSVAFPKSLKVSQPAMEASLRASGLADTYAAFYNRIEKCKQKFNKYKKPVQYNNLIEEFENKIQNTGGLPQDLSDGESSPELDTFIAGVQEIYHLTQSLGSDDPFLSNQPDIAGLNGISGLSKSVSIVNEEIERVLSESLKTFDCYKEDQKNLPEFRLLRIQLYMQAADTMYFMGKRDIAKKFWMECLNLDRLFLPALKNIAVYNMVTGQDHNRTLQGWKNYVEVLYFHAIAGLDPGISAADRAGFHRDFASAFTHGFIYIPEREKDESSKQENEDRRKKFVDLLNNPGSLREFVEHKRAEFLNRWFEIRSPTLLLGVPRTGKKEARSAMHETLSTFIKTTCASLPERIAAAFEKTCISKIDKALKLCEMPENLTLAKNPKYHDDERRMIEYIRDIYELKKQFLLAFNEMIDPDSDPMNRQRYEWELHTKYADFLQILDMLNSIPLGLNSDVINSAIQGFNRRFGGQKRLDEFLLDGCKRLLIGMVKSSRENPDNCRKMFDEIACNIRDHTDFWKKITGEWTGEDINIALYIDDPSHLGLYQPEILETLKSFGKEEQDDAKINRVIDLLAEWCKKYPMLTGPVHHLTILLCSRNRHAEAVEFLEHAVKQGFYKSGVDQCKDFLKKVRGPTKIQGFIKKKEFEAARNTALSELAESPENIEMIQQLIDIYMQMFKEDPVNAHKLVDIIEQQVTDAIENYREISEKSGATDENIASIIEAKRQVIAAAASGFTDSSDLQDIAKCTIAIDQLKKVIKGDKDNFTAVFYLMIALFTSGMNKLQQNTDDKGKLEFVESLDLADRIELESIDQNYKMQASNIKKKIEECRKLM